jgi:hypothetical protein
MLIITQKGSYDRKFPLGRSFAPDPRDQYHNVRRAGSPVARALAQDTVVQNAIARGYRHHKRGPLLDQQGPLCVLYTGAHIIEAGPTQQKWARLLMHLRLRGLTKATDLHGLMKEGYRFAQEHDEWAGTNYDGTSGRAGTKWLQSLGLVASYDWATKLQQMIDSAFVKPLSFGCSWFTGMDKLDKNGYIEPTGSWRGGHQIEVCSVNTTGRFFVLDQTWGGHPYRLAKLSFDSARYLLEEADGDCHYHEEIRIAA